jgi:glycerate 2-kinase
MPEAREDARLIFEAGVAAVQPATLIPSHIRLQDDTLCAGQLSIPLTETTKIIVVGAGKASAAMALAVEEIAGKKITAGLITTKYDHSLSLRYMEVIEAAHPVPDEKSVDAAGRTIALLDDAGENDIVICLLSGGASSLWTDLPGNITLDDLKTTFQLLLDSGATINEMNTVRKHLSVLKGGQFIRYAPAATWITLVISDVPGDDLSVIASGPTCADSSSFTDAGNVLNSYGLRAKIPASVQEYIQKGTDGKINETIKTGDPLLEKVHTFLIGNNSIALDAAQQKATQLGYHNLIIDPLIQGDVKDWAKKLWAYYTGYTGTKPACLLTGGETTIAVNGKGKGGRNQHMALEIVKAMMDEGTEYISFLAAGTDGTDGPTDAAGAFADAATVQAANDNSLPISDYLNNNDSYTFFEKTGSLLITGSTQTNVMDITVCIIN